MTTTGLDSKNFSNPECFDPDRWDKETSEDVLAFTSLPFGFGPRMCYGEYIQLMMTQWVMLYDIVFIQ